jgi:hypothetical protein
MDKLSPCPFCGNTDVALTADKTLQHTDECECWADVGDCWTVNCSAAGTESQPGRGCGATSGYHEDKAMAVAKWNRRSHSANPVVGDQQ